MNGGLVVIILVLLILLVVFAPMITQYTKLAGGLNKDQVKRHWQKLEGHIRQGEAGANHAVVQADKLLDYSLRKKGYKGETMSERLKHAESVFSSANDVWAAHKLRNKLVHEQGYKAGIVQARKAL